MDLKKKKIEMKEQKELVGPRLEYKVDVMLDPYKKNAGLPGLEEGKEDILSPTTPMMRKEAGFIVDRKHNPLTNAHDKETNQNSVKTFGNEVKGQLAFFQLAKNAD